jgi:hypothetical protein
LVVKQDFATNIQYHTKTPNIDFWVHVDLGIENFGCRKVGGPAKSGEVCHWVIEIGEPKIDDLNVACLRNDNILKLEIYQNTRGFNGCKKSVNLGAQHCSDDSSPRHCQSAAQIYEQLIPEVVRD